MLPITCSAMRGEEQQGAQQGRDGRAHLDARLLAVAELA